MSRLSTFPCLLQAPCVLPRLSPVLRALSCWASTPVLPGSGRQMSPTPRLPAYASWIPTSGTSIPSSWCGAVPRAPFPFSSPSWDPTWDPLGTPQLRSLCPGRGQLWHKEGPQDTSEVKGTEGDFSQSAIPGLVFPCCGMLVGGFMVAESRSGPSPLAGALPLASCPLNDVCLVPPGGQRLFLHSASLSVF